MALASEAAGGVGESWSAVVPILHGIGYWQVPLPLAETMVGALLLSMAGLPVPEGPIALIEQGQGNDLRARGDRHALKLTGTARIVAWARHARTAVVSLSDGRLALFDLRATSRVVCSEQLDPARLPSDTLRFDDAPCIAQAAHTQPMAQPVWALGALARSVMMVGALESALEQSVRYANERVQFGKPIGRNQAIQQQLALMAGDCAAARMAALAAAARCARAPPSPMPRPPRSASRWPRCAAAKPPRAPPASRTRCTARSASHASIRCISRRAGCGRGAISSAATRSGPRALGRLAIAGGRAKVSGPR